LMDWIANNKIKKDISIANKQYSENNISVY
jgi:hypothetical protein